MRYILWDNNCSVPPRIHMTPFTAAAAAAELPASGKARAQANGEPPPPPAGPQTLLLLLPHLLLRTHRPRLGLAAAPPQRPVCTVENRAAQRERRRGAGGARSAQAPAPARPGPRPRAASAATRPQDLAIWLYILSEAVFFFSFAHLPGKDTSRWRFGLQFIEKKEILRVRF